MKSRWKKSANSLNAVRELEGLYEKLPSEIREQLDRLKRVAGAEPVGQEPITEEDKRRIVQDIDKLFKKEPGGE